METILLFIGILIIVVVGHEFGHFIVARWNGVKVEEFGFGMPPKLFGFKPKGSDTEYTFNLFPIGGFVRLLGEDGDSKDNPRSFASKKPWQRIAILSAGVTMNIIIAVITFTIVGMMGTPTSIDESEIESNTYTNITPLITGVAKDSPAEQADLRFGDTIIAVNNIEVTTTQDIQNIVADNLGNTINFEIQRGDETLTKAMEARANPPEGQGATGISLELTGIQRLSFWESFRLSFVRIYFLITTTFYFLGQMIMSVFTQNPLPPEAEVTGPVGLVQIVGDFRDLGLAYIISFIGLISTSLALFNILPIPALDGGRIVFVIIEWIKKSPVSQTIENRFHIVGYAILMGLMILVTARDIINLF
jgi:regulator of sigma E protease